MVIMVTIIANMQCCVSYEILFEKLAHFYETIFSPVSPNKITLIEWQSSTASIATLLSITLLLLLRSNLLLLTKLVGKFLFNVSRLKTFLSDLACDHGSMFIWIKATENVSK